MIININKIKDFFVRHKEIKKGILYNKAIINNNIKRITKLEIKVNEFINKDNVIKNHNIQRIINNKIKNNTMAKMELEKFIQEIVRQSLNFIKEDYKIIGLQQTNRKSIIKCPKDADNEKKLYVCAKFNDVYCTRPKGHKGLHHAHGHIGECIKIWRDEQ